MVAGGDGVGVAGAHFGGLAGWLNYVVVRTWSWMEVGKLFCCVRFLTASQGGVACQRDRGAILGSPLFIAASRGCKIKKSHRGGCFMTELTSLAHALKRELPWRLVQVVRCGVPSRL